MCATIPDMLTVLNGGLGFYRLGALNSILSLWNISNMWSLTIYLGHLYLFNAFSGTRG